MQRLFKQIAGKASAGEREPQLMARAARRMNMDLPANYQIGARRARSYWYLEIEDVPSIHMDRARELAAIQPIEEAIDALQAWRRRINSEIEQLLEEVVAGGPAPAADHRVVADRRRVGAADRIALSGKARASDRLSAPPARLSLVSLRRLTAE